MCYMVVILGRALHSYLGSVVLGWRECWRINSVCALEEEIEFLDGIVTSGGQGQLFFCSSDDLLQQPTFVQRILNWRGVAATTSLEAVEITTHRSRIC